MLIQINLILVNRTIVCAFEISRVTGVINSESTKVKLTIESGDTQFCSYYSWKLFVLMFFVRFCFVVFGWNFSHTEKYTSGEKKYRQSFHSLLIVNHRSTDFSFGRTFFLISKELVALNLHFSYFQIVHESYLNQP